jgi:hypothetical protein
VRRPRFVIGAVLIVIGAIVLLNVLFHALGIAFRVGWVLWPLILIGVGVWLVTGFARGGGRRAIREQASVPLEGATSAAIVVHHGAGRLSIGSGAAAGQLLTGVFGGGLDAERRREGQKLVVDMRVKEKDLPRYLFGSWGGGWARRMDWDFVLGLSVPLELRLETGASESVLSLADLDVRDLTIRTGASSTTVELPRVAAMTRVSIECGAAAVRLKVPPTVAASIVVKSALAGVRVDPSRFPAAGAGWESPGFGTAPNRVEIFVETGVGSVEIS